MTCKWLGSPRFIGHGKANHLEGKQPLLTIVTNYLLPGMITPSSFPILFVSDRKSPISSKSSEPEPSSAAFLEVCFESGPYLEDHPS